MSDIRKYNCVCTLEESGLIYGRKEPPKLAKCDALVREGLLAIREGWGIVNGAVFSGAIQRILSVEAPHKLVANGGDVDPNAYSLIQSLHQRTNNGECKTTIWLT